MILVFGRTGQVATALRAACDARGLDHVCLGREEADFAEPSVLARKVEEIGPDIVINAVAYTAVDQAESEAELARLINAEAPAAIARACAARDIPFLHLSTDFVFDGTAERPYREDDETNPLSVYGATKREGEELILAAGGRPVILRTSWVFSETGKNFVKTMLRLAETRDELTIVADQQGQPTPAADIAEALLDIAAAHLADRTAKTGLYHFSGTGSCSWAGFAREIFRQAGLDTRVKEITTAQFPTDATRPAWSVMDCSKIAKDFDIHTREWQTGLERVLTVLGRQE